MKKLLLFLLGLGISGYFGHAQKPKIDSLFSQSGTIVRGRFAEWKFEKALYLGKKAPAMEHWRVLFRPDLSIKTDCVFPPGGISLLVSFPGPFPIPDLARFPDSLHNQSVWLFLPKDWSDSSVVYLPFCIFPAREFSPEAFGKFLEAEKIPVSFLWPRAEKPDALDRSILEGNWDRARRLVKDYISRELHEESPSEGWLAWLRSHHQVRYVIPPEAVLDVLPTTATYLVEMANPDTLVRMVIPFQLGRVIRLWCLYSIYQTRYIALKDIRYLPADSYQYGQSRLQSLKQSFHDSTPGATPLPWLPPDPEWMLLTYLWEGNHYWNLHWSVPEYWDQTILELKSQRTVMNLSLGIYHGHPRVVLASLEALKELRDPRAIPALLRLAKELAASESALAHPHVQPIAEALMLCLDRLCGTRVFAARPKMDLKPLLTEGIKVWASKVKVEGLYSFDPELT